MQTSYLSYNKISQGTTASVCSGGGRGVPDWCTKWQSWDELVAADENKDNQVLFLEVGSVKLHVQCEHVTYAQSSSKMDPSSFVT